MDADLEQLMKETQEAMAALQAGQPLASISRPPQPDKRRALEDILSKGMLQVQVDTTLPGVDLPDDLLGQLLVLLNFSYNFAGRDLQLSNEEIRCTLSFGGRPYFVKVPLKAIIAAKSLASGQVQDFQVFAGDVFVEPEEDSEPPKEPA